MKLLRVGSAWAVMFVAVSGVFSQDAGSKIRDGGVAHGMAHTVAMNQRHVQDRSQILQYHIEAQQTIPKDIAHEMVVGIKKDLAASDKALAGLKMTYAKNTDAVKLIDSIMKHHATTQTACNTVEEHVLKDNGDHVAVSEGCSTMWHEVEAAKVETTKLLKLLKLDKLPTPKKAPAPPKEDTK